MSGSTVRSRSMSSMSTSAMMTSALGPTDNLEAVAMGLEGVAITRCAGESKKERVGKAFEVGA